MTARHRSALVEYTYVGNPGFDQRLSQISQGMQAKGYHALPARQMALSVIDRTIQAQAQTQSYNNAFLLIGVFVALVSPAVFLLRNKKRAAGPVPDAH